MKRILLAYAVLILLGGVSLMGEDKTPTLFLFYTPHDKPHHVIYQYRSRFFDDTCIEELESVLKKDLKGKNDLSPIRMIADNRISFGKVYAFSFHLKDLGLECNFPNVTFWDTEHEIGYSDGGTGRDFAFPEKIESHQPPCLILKKTKTSIRYTFAGEMIGAKDIPARLKEIPPHGEDADLWVIVDDRLSSADYFKLLPSIKAAKLTPNCFFLSTENSSLWESRTAEKPLSNDIRQAFYHFDPGLAEKSRNR